MQAKLTYQNKKSDDGKKPVAHPAPVEKDEKKGKKHDYVDTGFVKVFFLSLAILLNFTSFAHTEEIASAPFDLVEICDNGLDDDGDGLIDCQDPDCQAVAAPQLEDDIYSSCIGTPFSELVTINDSNLQNPVFSIFSQPTYGMVSIDGSGKFTYTPLTTECLTDVFVYQVCNGATGCCSTASVTVDMADNTPPVLTNVPADLTIGCDDRLPDPDLVIAFDECPGIFIDFDETAAPLYGGTCEAYTLTRTWTAIDLCGNSVSDDQVITVLDQTKPEIFQVYTLANGARMVAGVAQRVTDDWKYIPFPITFDGTPMIFTTVTSSTENAPVTVRQRNAHSQGFEMKLSEEEAADGDHAIETVAWIAVEPSQNAEGFKMSAGRWDNVDELPQTLNFANIFGNEPGLLTSIQSTNDDDPVNVRLNNLGAGSADVFLQEETSADAEVDHGFEHVGYLAFQPEADLIDAKGKAFGESGRLDITNAWTSVVLNRSYTKPVVVIGAPSNQEPDAVNVRVQNVTGNSFEVRLEEWNNHDGNHSPESVSWIVMEGSIPGNQGFYCSGSADLEPGINVFAVDNCDAQVSFGYTETPTVTASGTLTTRSWIAIDDCGNTNFVTRFDTCSTAALELKASLFGAHINASGGLMRDDLRSKEIIPVWEPFSKLSAFGHVEDHSPSGDNNNGPVTAEVPAEAQTAVYSTIADGNWLDDAIWEGGSAPTHTTVNNKTIAIQHQVVLTTGNLYLKNNTSLWIINGGLTVTNGEVNLQGAQVYCDNARLEVTNYDLINWSGSPEFFMKNSELVVGSNFINYSGVRSLDNVCMTVLGDYHNEATDTLRNCTGTFQNKFENTFGGDLYASSCKFDVSNGDFVNGASSTLNGEELTIWVENGDLKNLGVWNATINQYCVSASTLGLSGAQLPVAEDCSGMADYFTSENCTAATAPPNQSGDPTGEEITPEGIAGPGSIDPVMLEVQGDDAVVDWLLVELRDPADENEIVDYATVILQRNGDVVSEDGDPVINFLNMPEGDYYVTIRHRNHIGVMTDSTIYLSTENPPFLDFSNPDFDIRGGDSALKVNGDELSMWAGDFNLDGKVIFQGPYNDIFSLFSRVLSDIGNAEYLANYIVNDYDENDLNLDGKVIYQGPGNDRAFVLYHSILSHPGNTSFLANYIITGPLP